MSYDTELERRLWAAFAKPALMAAAKSAVELYGKFMHAGFHGAAALTMCENEKASAQAVIRAITMNLSKEDAALAGAASMWMLWRAGNPYIGRSSTFIAWYKKASIAKEKLAYPLDARPDFDVVVDKRASFKQFVQDIAARARGTGATLKDLAHASGVPYPSLHAWSTGLRSPRKEKIPAILTALQEAVKDMEQTQ